MLILRLKKKGLKTYYEWLSSYKVAFKEILYEGNKFFTKDLFLPLFFLRFFALYYKNL